MIHTSRRSLLMGAVALIPVGLALNACTTPSVTFSQVQGYVATAVAALDKLGPIVEALDPSIAPQMNKIIADADAAAAAFAELSSPTGGAAIAQDVLVAIEDGLTLAESIPGIPPTDTAIMAGVELLLVTIGGFFGLSSSVADTAVTRAYPGATQSLRVAALNQYNAASNKQTAADTAQSQIRAWLAQ